MASALLTDLYELTMAAAYFDSGVLPIATFELFARRFPPNRTYLVTAGLEQALEYLEALRFTGDDIDYLCAQPVFAHVSKRFFEHLRELRFNGDVWAMPEGTIAFPNEPILRVTAPMIEAQIVETYLLAQVCFQTLVASKAARVVEAAQGRPVVEFGTRRAHGPESGVLAARASFIGGCTGTSNVEAGKRFGIPIFGTLAHSFIMTFDDESESFRRFEQIFPDDSVLLVDTYDTLAAINKIIAAGLRPKGVRIDSGDLAEEAREVRRRLDAGGLRDTTIFASGDLNEYSIAELLAKGAPIDAFGVGTELAVSYDAPALSGVYKLVEIDRAGEHSYAIKLSGEKTTLPGAKQVFRISRDGAFDYDLIACAGEQAPGGEPLLKLVMQSGKRTHAARSLRDVQRYAREQLARLPEELRRSKDPAAYRVDISPELRRLQERETRRHTR
ncbi:MAG: nicotinate phosphoribosyltransferase [Terriglobales bacterium]